MKLLEIQDEKLSKEKKSRNKISPSKFTRCKIKKNLELSTISETKNKDCKKKKKKVI